MLEADPNAATIVTVTFAGVAPAVFGADGIVVAIIRAEKLNDLFDIIFADLSNVHQSLLLQDRAVNEQEQLRQR